MSRKLTREQVNERLAPRGIELIGKYAAALERTTFRCPKGHKWIATPARVMAGANCRFCAGRDELGRKPMLSGDVVKKNLLERGISIVGEYAGTRKTARFRCALGHEWPATVDNVWRGTGCPHCADTALLSSKIVNERIAARGIQLVGEYRSALHKTIFRCSRGHTWSTTPDSVMRGSGCRICSGKAPLSREKVNERIAARGIRIIGRFRGVDYKATFRCSQDHEWQATPNGVMSGKGCMICAGNAPLSSSVVNDRIASRGIRLTGAYRGSLRKTEFKCSAGHMWKTTPSKVMGGTGCPECADYGFNPDSAAILYYIRVETRYGEWWKIGVSNYSVAKRFKGDLKRITVIREWPFERGVDAYKIEQEVLREFKLKRERKATPLSQGGNSELFKFDVLSLDDLPRKLS